MKFISLDIETTGLDIENHQIIEFGGLLEDTSNPDVPCAMMPQFRWYVYQPEYRGSPFALSLNAAILKKIAEFEAQDWKSQGLMFFPSEIAGKFRQFVLDNGLNPKQIVVAGKNAASFDIPFLKRLPKWKDSGLVISHRVLDPSILFTDFENDVAPAGTGLCAKRAGVESGAHTTIEDSWTVIELLRKGTKNYTRKTWLSD